MLYKDKMGKDTESFLWRVVLQRVKQILVGVENKDAHACWSLAPVNLLYMLTFYLYDLGNNVLENFSFWREGKVENCFIVNT